METFLIVSQHTLEDCDRAIQYFHDFHEGYFKKFWWGCKDGDHNSYAIIEAENHEHAKMAVPPLAREKTKIIKLVHFDLVGKHSV